MSGIKKFTVNNVDASIAMASDSNAGFMSSEQYTFIEGIRGTGEGDAGIDASIIKYDNKTTGMDPVFDASTMKSVGWTSGQPVTVDTAIDVLAKKQADLETHLSGLIFDVSEANNGTSYKSLADALSVANDILKPEQKKGGMTIKFIQTTPAKYTVVKTEGATEQPTGTEIQSDPGIISGTYTAEELNVFSKLPATLNSSLTYYLTVTETVNEQEVATYTTWVITYVQTSDNKYVQFRYMSSSTTVADFTNIANWQGVDDKPTAGSNNLVKSGGVDDSITNVASNLRWQLETMFYSFRAKPDTTTGKFVDAGASGYASFYAQVTAGELLKIECKTPYSAGAVCFSETVPTIGGDFTDVVSFTTAGVKIVTAPYNGYIVIYRTRGTSDYYLYKKEPNIDNYIKHVIKANYTTNAGIDCAEGSDTYGEQVSLGGTTKWGVTDAVDISEYSYVSILIHYTTADFSYSSTNNYCIGSMFYDENMTPILAIAITKTAYNSISDYSIVKRPDTAKYVRVCKYVSGYDYTLIFGIDRTPVEVSDEVRNAIAEAVVDVEKDLYAPMELTECNYSLLESGKFGSNGSYKHCVLAVAEGEKYLVKGFSTSRYAFATTDEYTAGEDVPVVDGTSVTTIYDNAYYPVIIPAGCTWLLVNSNAAGNDVRKYEGSVSEQIENAISGLDVDVTDAYINDYKEAEEIDLESIDSYSKRKGSFNPDGWKYVGTVDHMIFDVFGDDCMIKVTANDSYPAYVAFVDDISCPLDNEAVPFVEGTSRITVDVGETKYLMVPKETVALLVYLGNPNTEYVYKPSALTIYRNRNTRSVDGIVVNASYMTVNENTGVIETDKYFVGRALKVRNGDVFYINASSPSIPTKIGGFLDTLPVIDSLVAVNAYINSKYFYRQFVSDRDGWFVYFGKANASFSVNYQGSAKDAVVKKDEASFKNYLSTINYKKIDLLELPLYNVSYLDSGVFGTANFRSVFVDVREASFVKIASNSNNPYCRIGWVTEIGTPADGGVPSYVPSCPGAIRVYGTQVLEVPSGANYMLVYLGSSSSDYPFAPSYVGLYGTEDEGSFGSYEQLVIDFNARRDRTLTEHSTIGLTPRIIPVDDDGWEIPESLQQINAQKKSEQLVKIRWTPKWDVPAKYGNNYTANTEVTTGIPYSSNNDDGSKTIGEETSIHTFMTAVDNPYSLLYTECVNNETKVPSASKPNAPRQASYWGKTYTLSSNGFAYYGTVCCGLTSSVENSPLKWNNPVIRSYTLTNGAYIPVCAPGVVDFNLIKIGDICDNMSHSFMVYGLHRDSNGEIDQVKYVESTSIYSKGGCRIVTSTRQAFAEHVNRSGNPFTIFRYVKLWDNTDYEASEYVPLTERGESATAVTYNNAICTFAGDKCTFRAGDLIVVNYNLYGTQAHDWTKIQVYKDDVLLNEYTLAEAEQTLTNYLTDNEVTPNPFNSDINEHNHALVLGTELTEGMYKACMVDANGNASDYTYWEVLDNAVTAVELGKDEYEVTVSGTHLIQVIYVNNVSMYYLPTYEEQQTRKFIVRPAALAELFGKTHEGYEVSVKLAGAYGNATTVPVKLYGGDVTPDEEPDDDDND